MFTVDTVTVLIVSVALGVLIWGYNKARQFGKLGILAWLQSVVLMVPWLLFFGLFAAGIYINLIGILCLLVASAGFYIYIGNQLRALGQDDVLRERAAKMLAERNPPQDATTTPLVKSEVIPIPDADLSTIKEIFGIDTFFITETISYEEGAIFKGNMRGEPETVYSRLSENLAKKIGDRYRLFLVESPEEKPVVIVLPSSNDPKPATTYQKFLAVVLLLATVATSLEAAGLLLRFDLTSDLSRVRETLPIGLGLWVVLGAHELGHWWMARRYGVRLGFPYFIPSWQIGSFGALTRFESLLRDRSVLFDISIAGPIAGGIVSFILLLAGLLLSHPGSAFQVPAQFFQGSILVGTLAKVVLGSALQETIVDIHPLTVVGWLGLLITALNLMPAGQLDGGRVVQAIYGRKTARRTTIATLIILGILSLTNPGNSIILYWAIVILFLQRGLERPSLNELTEPNDARAAIGLLALFLMIATLIPLTPGIAGRLGIG